MRCVCGTETHGIQEDNGLWCETCGASLGMGPRFVVGYCQSHSRRNQVYSRRKRFGKYLQEVVDDVRILRAYYRILDLYSQYEFVWMGTPSTRKYFFAKPVMLKGCCQVLGLPTDDLPSLKDKNREIEQAKQLESLRATTCWQQSYAMKNDFEAPSNLQN